MSRKHTKSSHKRRAASRMDRVEKTNKIQRGYTKISALIDRGIAIQSKKARS